MTDKVNSILDKIKEQRNVFKGIILTGDIFILKKEKREELVKNFDGFCCEMEGAAIAQVSSLNNVPFTVIRLISDLPNDQWVEDYVNFEKESAKMSCLALKSFLEE